MSRTPKKAVAAVDAADLVGETALVRSQIWQNGKTVVAAIITEATTDPLFLRDEMIALVSLTAFPPGQPSRMMRDVPLYAENRDESTLPATWVKPR
jgi:hypothetical protein